MEWGMVLEPGCQGKNASGPKAQQNPPQENSVSRHCCAAMRGCMDPMEDVKRRCLRPKLPMAKKIGSGQMHPIQHHVQFLLNMWIFSTARESSSALFHHFHRWKLQHHIRNGIYVKNGFEKRTQRRKQKWISKL